MSQIVSSAAPPTLSAFFTALRLAGVRYCLLRPLPRWEGPDGGDIDVLVEPGALDQATAEGVKCGFSIVPGRHQGRHLLLYDPDLPGWLWLHLVDELSFGPRYRLLTLAAEACLSRAVTDDGVQRLRPGDEFWATLLHCLLDKGRIPERHRSRLLHLGPLASADDPIARPLAKVCPPPWSPAAMVGAALREDWPSLERLPSGLVARWPRFAPSRPPPGALARVRGAVEFRLRHVRRGGIGVALVGPDGAGKTTLAGEIARGFPFPVRRIYMGLTGGTMRYVSRLRVPGLVLLGRIGVIWWRYLGARLLQAGSASQLVARPSPPRWRPA